MHVCAWIVRCWMRCEFVEHNSLNTPMAQATTHPKKEKEKEKATTRLPKDIEMVTKLKYFDLSSDWPLHLEYVLILVTFY